MHIILRVEGDPASWWVRSEASAEALAQQLSQASDPVSLEVVSPLRGQLILSPQHRGSFAVLAPLANVGWVPSGIVAPAATLYVPSQAGPTPHFPGYRLAHPADLATLEQNIVAAMRQRSVLTVQVSSPGDNGVIVLNGAALAFAVLCPTPPAA